MAARPYRVIQWATGTVGQVAIRHFADNPVFELVGTYVTNPDKVGKDAGDIAGTRKTGVLATDDKAAILAMEADCVHFAPLIPDLDMVCELLRSGKNVVSPLGPFYPSGRHQHLFDKLEAACRSGRSSFYGSGVHPGFAGDLLVLPLTRLMSRIDRIYVYEIINKVKNPMVYLESMGFGVDPDELLARPYRSSESPYSFAQGMGMVVQALGKKIDDLDTRFSVATAKEDIPHYNGVLRKGTVAGQRYDWTAIVDGQPFMSYHACWTAGDDLEPNWNLGESRYSVIIEGDPPMELNLIGGLASDARRPFEDRPFPALPWTSLVGVTAIPDVCDSQPGVVTIMDLGLVKPRGLIRPASEATVVPKAYGEMNRPMELWQK